MTTIMNTDVLQMSEVTLPPSPGSEMGVQGIDLRLQPGMLVAIHCQNDQAWPHVAEGAMGLVIPESGTVSFLGETWETRTADAAAAARHRIGRVFRERGWLSNLDVDENITLAARHHSRRPPAEIRAEALQVASRFGWSELPMKRPAWSSAHDLQVAQWIRALLGPPALLILEEPVHDVNAAEVAALLESLAEYRRDGGAVLWLTQQADRINKLSLNPSLLARIDHGRWECVP